MNKQLKINITDGIFFISDNMISNKVSEEGLTDKTITNLTEDKYVFDLISNYKNGKLDHIILTLASSYLIENKLNKSKDTKEYINLWIMETNKMINQLIKTEQRKFDWGKIDIKTDPRNPTVFAEFKFLK